MPDVPAIGITGGISTGKSSFVNCLREILPAVTFFDADAVARELTEHDPAVAEALRERFGSQVLDAKGQLNRVAMRAIVFTAPEKRRVLEEILHPPIRQRWSGEAAKYRQSSEFFFADIPLLYETGGDKLCDWTVVVACSAEIQMQRLMKRTGIDEEAARAMIAAQMSLEEKIKRAEHVVWNNGPKPLLADQARLLVNLWTSR